MTFPLNRRALLVLAPGGMMTLGAAGVQARPEAIPPKAPGYAELISDPAQPVLGNPKGDVTIVEFFDYQCPFCRKSYPEMQAFVRKDGNLRWMMKDWPMFGPVSDRATMIALGAVKLGRYAEVNAAIMALPGRHLSVEQVDAAAKSAGVEAGDALDSFQKDYNSWTELVGKNIGEAYELGLMGTPGFVVGQDLFNGATPIADLSKAVARLRRG